MTWQEFYSQYINIEPGIFAIMLRLLCAMLVGTLIGIEREYTHRPAGLRTHILVALGACVASVMGQMLFYQYGNSDPARLSAQVITGVGFLGAGTIMKEGISVKGLTTAASVWAVACLGIAAGFGFYALALAGTVFTFITLTVFEAFQQKLILNHSAEDQYTLLCDQTESILQLLNKCANDPRITIFDLTVTRDGTDYVITFRAWFVGRKQEKRRGAFCAALAAVEGVKRVNNTSVETKV